MDKGDDKKDGREPRETEHKKRDRGRRAPRVGHQEGFHGEHKDLLGFVYTYDSAARANQYEKTTKKISEWVEKELMFSRDIWKAITTLEDPDTNSWKPKVPDKDAVATKLEESLFNEEIKEYVLRKRTYANNTFKVYSIVLGQCSEGMKAKLEGLEDWTSIHEKHDLTKLLKSVKVWMLNQQSDRNPILSTYAAISALFKMRQQRHEELPEFRKRFVGSIEVLEHMGVSLGASLTTITNGVLVKSGSSRNTASKDILNKAETNAVNKLLAVAFIQSADKARYQQVGANLENEFLKGNDQYPADVTAAYSMLTNWKLSGGHRENTTTDGLSFVQGEQHEDGRPGGSRRTTRDRSNDKCHKCGIKGHHAWEVDVCKAAQAVAEAERKRKSASMHAMTQGNYEIVTGGDDRDSDQDYEFAFCTTDDQVEQVHRGQLFKQHRNLVYCVTTNSFNRRRAQLVTKGSIGLDSMSSVDVFADARLLKNIREVDETMRIVCNAGTVVVNKMGDFPGYGTVWFHEDAIANILSLSNVQKQFRVTYDSVQGNCFTVHRPDGSSRVFSPTEKGLYTSKVLDPENTSAMMVSTVNGNKKSYTRRQIRDAEEARRLQIVMGRPSDRKMKEIIAAKLLRNCPVTEADVANARMIFGPDIGSLKGKTVRRKVEHVDLGLSRPPSELVRRYKYVTVCFDIMYLNGTPFLVSISRDIKFCTTEAVANRQDSTLMKSLKKIKATYAARGFIMNQAAGDNEFASLDVALSNIGVRLNVVARDEHVPEIERYIRTLKERCRATFNSLPFKKMPTRMVIELVYAMTFWLHAFPTVDCVSTTISPRELVTGVVLDAGKHCVLPFGAYVQTHEQHDNTMQTRTVGGIALRPTGNVQGSHYFFSLSTGKRISRSHWTEVPMPADIIKRVHLMAARAAGVRLQFGDRDNAEVDEEHDDADDEASAYNSSSEESATTDSDDGEEDEDSRVRHLGQSVPAPSGPGAILQLDGRAFGKGENRPKQTDEDETDEEVGYREGDTDEDDADNEAAETEQEHGIDNHEEAETGHHDEKNNGVQDADPAEGCDDIDVDANEGEMDDQPAGVPQDDGDTGESLEQQMQERYGTRSGAYGLRERKKPNYDVSALAQVILAQKEVEVVPPAFDAAELTNVGEPLCPLVSVILTQYGMKKGLRLYGEQGDNAVRKEMQQLHDREVMHPRSPASINREDRAEALQYLMFLKRKRDGTIKGRGCADGRKQRRYIDKKDSSSPTISTEAVLLIITIAAKEQRDVATVDIPGAFMQTDLDGERILIRFEGRMAELLAMIDPKLYRPHIAVEKDKPVLYADLRKVLYGMVQASLKFWNQVVGDLTALGYEVNPYDWCVANKMVNGKQHTVGWHVDDFILTHEDPAVNDDLISWFQQKYGTMSPLTVHRGHTHDYLGMTLDFTMQGQVKVTMIDYVQRLLEDAPDDFDGWSATPAAKHLFEINDQATKLDKQRAMTFHNVVAKTVFLSKRARPDVQLAVGFLSTRVREPDEDDWKKLGRMIQYLRNTSELILTLEGDETQVVKWWVDAAFAVHKDMRSQSGGIMSLGKGAMYSASTRQKLNTKSSTEAELVGVNDFMPQVLWTRYFLEGQGYEVRDNVVFQDNQSAILLENNGKGSSSKRTRHIDIRYFFITDRVRSNELSVQYCSTKEMLADFFTKPLQGALFTKFRNAVLNIK